MNDVGIITFHFSLNYGSSLQCVSLNNFLIKNKKQPVVINYQPYYHTQRYALIRNPIYYYKKRPSFMRVIKAVFWISRDFLYLPFTAIKKYKYNSFLKQEVKLTKKITNKNLLPSFSDLESCISGGDQIWNINATEGVYDPPYFLSFLAPNVKRIAFSASAQQGYLEFDKDNSICDDLRKYSKIMVRETTLCNFLNENHIKASTTLDPVFLLDKDDFEKMESPKHFKKKYVLVYSLDKNHQKELLELAVKYFYSKGYKIIDISPKKVFGINHVSSKLTCGPKDFLFYIHHASAVLIDSFHGFAFSLIYQKPFLLIPRERNDKRAADLMKQLNLTNRIFSEKDKEKDVFDLMFEGIDYDAVAEKLGLLKEDTKKQLIGALS